MALIEVLHSVRFEFDLNDRLQGLVNAVSLFLSGRRNKNHATYLRHLILDHNLFEQFIKPIQFNNHTKRQKPVVSSLGL